MGGNQLESGGKFTVRNNCYYRCEEIYGKFNVMYFVCLLGNWMVARLGLRTPYFGDKERRKIKKTYKSSMKISHFPSPLLNWILRWALFHFKSMVKLCSFLDLGGNPEQHIKTPVHVCQFIQMESLYMSMIACACRDFYLGKRWEKDHNKVFKDTLDKRRREEKEAREVDAYEFPRIIYSMFCLSVSYT